MHHGLVFLFTFILFSSDEKIVVTNYAQLRKDRAKEGNGAKGGEGEFENCKVALLPSCFSGLLSVYLRSLAF